LKLWIRSAGWKLFRGLHLYDLLPSQLFGRKLALIPGHSAGAKAVSGLQPIHRIVIGIFTVACVGWVRVLSGGPGIAVVAHPGSTAEGVGGRAAGRAARVRVAGYLRLRSASDSNGDRKNQG